MKRRHVVVVGQAWRCRLERIAAFQVVRVAARFEEDDAAPVFGQPRRERTAAGAGADDDVFVLIVVCWTHQRPLSGRRQNRADRQDRRDK